MVLLYEIEYYDVENVLHRIEIGGPESIGQELILNGGFTTLADWNQGFNWSINTGTTRAEYSYVAPGGYISQPLNYPKGNTYKVTYEVVDVGGAGVVAFGFFGVAGEQLGTNQINLGFHTETITLDETYSDFGIKSENGSGGISNVSVTQVPDAVQIRGKAHLLYTEAKNILDPIRGKGLRLNLEASEDLTFEDLYSEEERTFTVQYFRDGDTLFSGWLNPEGVVQNYVNERWFVSLLCVDGFGMLQNLSFVNPTTLSTITGQQKEIDVLAVCLKRTGILQNINTAIDIYYDGLTETLDVLANTYFNAERFLKFDEQTIMSCRQVIVDTLEIYGAVITSLNGEWFIYKPNQLFLDPIVDFFKYDSEGVSLGKTGDIDFSFTLGSQINNFYPHHAKEDQQVGNAPSLGGFRIEYNYGFEQSLINNTTLINIGGVVADWTIDVPASVILPPSGESGLLLVTVISSPSTLHVMTSDAVLIPIGIVLTVSFTMGRLSGDEWEFNFFYFYKIVIEDADNPGDFYYFSNLPGNVGWYLGETTRRCAFEKPVLTQIITQEILATPVEGDLQIILLEPAAGLGGEDLQVDLVSLRPSSVEGGSTVIGEIHDFARTTKPSSKVPDVNEVFNGDNPTDIYVGTIYKSDQATPTESWHRKGFSTEDAGKPIIRIMGEEKMRMNSKPNRVFSGSVYGYVPYLSVVTIDGFTGLFMILKYNYDTMNNITRITFKQMQGAELGDLTWERQDIFQKPPNTTIRGAAQ